MKHTISLRFAVSLAALAGCMDGSATDPRAAPGHAALRRAAIDIVLETTWEPPSGTVIDCHGGAILPRKRAEANRGLSVPDTLIFLGPAAQGVHIRNCTLDATFPIVSLGGGSHVISDNVIRGHSRGVFLFGSSHNLLYKNVFRTSGRSVQIGGDSDGNVVLRNDISFIRHGGGIDGYPGLTWREHPGGVGVGTFTYPGVNNVIVNGKLYQDVSLSDTHPDGTQVLHNTIHNEGGDLGIIFATRARDGYAYRNEVYGGGLGLAVFGFEDFAEFLVPGTCSGDPTMRCSGDLSEPGYGCVLPGIDAGVCEGAKVVKGGGRVVATKYVENSVSGAEIGFLGAASDGLDVEANDLEGGYAGLLLFGYALDKSTILGNKTSGNQVGLVIEHDNFNFVENPGLELSYNDFGDNERAFDAYSLVFDDNWEELIDVLPYELPTSLPHNWWGGETCGFPASAEQWPATEDPSPAARPIAKAWRKGLADGVARCAP